LLGRTAVALSFRGREGRVRIGDSEWPARLAGGVNEPSTGAMLHVVAVEGTVVVVRPH
jgi:membrane protein implicated in regulation of membrane protease activity